MPQSRSKILFLINEEHGQANICLSAIYELYLSNTHEIHVGSWPGIQKRLQSLELSAHKITRSSNTSKLIFHKLPGLGMVKSIYRFVTDSIPCHGRGIRSCLRIFNEMKLILGDSRSPEEYLEIYDFCVSLIEKVNSQVVVLDPFMGCGIDACRRLGQKFVILTPNSLKDVVLFEQPWGKVLWKYPALGTGLAFPVPWYLIPANVLIVVMLIFVMITSSEFKALNAARKARGLTWTYPLLEPFTKEAPYICASCPETDLPLDIPPNVTPCGPILLPFEPVSTVDPELASWLQQKPTIFLHFGSHFVADEHFSTQVACAIRILLLICPGVQVLWKLVKHGEYGQNFAKTIDKEIEDDKVRLVGWLNVEPLAILDTGNIACIVHHGGATSYNEAISTGTPQVICPLWLDCLDYAARVGWLGIGVDGNCQVGFPVEGEELASAMIKVIGYPGMDEQAKSMKSRAQSLSISSRGYGGRVKAAYKIMEFIGQE